MFAPSLRRPFAVLLSAAQLLAVAHLALVPHTTSASGGVASSGFSIEEHLDAVAFSGAHAHDAAPQQAAAGEEHCAVFALLRAGLEARAAQAQRRVASRLDVQTVAIDAPFAPTRRELLLAAPKASPPVFAGV